MAATPIITGAPTTEHYPNDRTDRARLIRNARNGCFAEGLIVQSVPLNSTIGVNGNPFLIEGITRD